MKGNFSIQCREKTLRCEFSIVEYEGEPILMVMRDEFGNLFLCLCSEIRAMRRWIVAPTLFKTLHRLIDFEATVNDALRAGSRFAYVIEKQGREYHSSQIAFDAMPSCFLAEEGAYADFMEEDCEANLARLEQDRNSNAQGYFIDFYRESVSENQRVFYHEAPAPKPGDEKSFPRDCLIEQGRKQRYAVHDSQQPDTYDHDDPRKFAA